MASSYPERRWLWAVLTELGERDEAAAESIVSRLTDEDRELLLYAALQSQALLLRDVRAARRWHDRSGGRWAQQTLEDLLLPDYGAA